MNTDHGKPITKFGSVLKVHTSGPRVTTDGPRVTTDDKDWFQTFRAEKRLLNRIHVK